MDFSGPYLLSAYCVGIFLMSVLGGSLSKLFELTHTRMQVVMASVAGLIVGVAVLHLLPHSLSVIPGDQAADTAAFWLVLGLVVTLLMLYMFDFHEHDFSAEHSHQHDHPARGGGVKPFSWFGIALGLSLHSLTEGIALGSSMRLMGGGEASLAGFGVFLAIALHKPLDAFSIISTMKLGGYSLATRRIANLCFAALCPLAVIATVCGTAQLGVSEALVIGCALAFAAGMFLCIALSDLLPEAHFHSHDRALLTAGFLAGVAVAYALQWLEPSVLHGVHRVS